MRQLGEMEVSGRRVLVRVDFNVPLEAGEVADDSRIRACLPTINYLRERGARVVLCSHLGRPRGRDPGLSLKPVARRLSELLGAPVPLAPDCVGEEVIRLVEELKPGGVLLLENLRFHPEEEKNDEGFARELARLADVYINDAFAVSHRAHASVEAIARLLPSAAGFLLEKEVRMLGRLLQDPAHPFAALLGGAKVQDKMGVLDRLLERVDKVLIGGGMAATFLKAAGCGVGSSPVEEDRLDYCRQLMERAAAGGKKVVLPKDVAVTPEIRPGAPVQVVEAVSVPEGHIIADIGPEAVRQFARELEECRTVFWNGPMGVFEIPEFARGTRELAHLLAGLEAVTVVGGGSTVEAVTELGLAERLTHVSTGGGASLELLEGRTLPGIAALER